MKIDITLLHISGRGGMEKVLKLVINELVRRGHIVRMFVACKPEYPEFEQGLAIRVNTYGPYYEYYGQNDILDLMRTYKLILENTYIPDVMLGTMVPIFTAMCRDVVNRMKLTKPPKIISWVHGDTTAQGKEVAYYKHADGAFALTGIMENTIRKANPNIPILNIGNPFEASEIIAGDQYKDLPLNKHNLFMAGRYSTEKNMSLGCKITKLTNEYRMDVYGCGSEFETEKLQKTYPNAIWNGWIQNPIDYHINKYHERGILILPSLNESFGYVILEAINRGCLVLSTPTEGAQELIDENNGMLFKDLDDLMRKLRDIDVNNYSFENIKQKVYKYETNKVVDAMLKFIQEI